jgi:ribosomal protein S18 acetylase RimI-like enzyme
VKGRPAIEIGDLPPPERELAVPILIDSFEGIYRWHAKRTLREVSLVRAARIDGGLAGVAMLERLVPEVGYVYYLAVAPAQRRQGVAGTMLDDALLGFRRAGVQVAYAAVEEENAASQSLFRSRGFRTVERREPGYAEGGLGAWGLRSRMRLVYGEQLLGVRLEPSKAGPDSRLPVP